MKKNAISTRQAPQAIGPYSQAIQAGNWLFISGQIPLDPATGQIVTDNIQAETRRVMENLQAILAAAQLDFACVVKTTIYLTNINDFSEVNAVYAEYFKETPPARATVAVMALPKGAHIEIDAVALFDVSQTSSSPF